MDITTRLYMTCGHDSHDVDGCVSCEAAAEISRLRAAVQAEGKACAELAITLTKGKAPASAIVAALKARSNAKVRGDAPLYGAASLSTDGLCGDGKERT